MRLFGTAGIRGTLWEKVTPELAMKVGMAVGTYKSGKALVGRDGRTSSVMLKNAMISGLLSTGMEVLDADLIPTPALAWGTRKLADAGVMITASHNPPTDNGVKVFNGDGTEFYVEQERGLEEIIFSGNFRKARWDEIKPVRNVEVIPDYINAVLDFVGHETNLKVLYDGANGAGSLVAPYLLREMGAKVLSVNAHVDGHFPGRKPEPRYENIAYLGKLVRELGVDLAIAQDGDADRIAVFDEKGNYVDEDTVIALFAKLYVEEHGGGTVVVSIDTGSRIDAVVERAGGRVVRIPLGQPHDGIKRYKAIFAAEPWKLVHPKFGPWIDPFVTMGLLIKLIDENGPLSELVKEIPTYYLKKANVLCPDEYKAEVVRRAAEEVERKLSSEIKEVLTISGFRIALNDGSWILIRPSGTEPKIRVVAEAPTEKRRDELFEMAYSTVSRIVKEAEKK
ncbi:phosphopentomutase [Thermococcus kodakarensis KOD1]|uniref:Phosphopentomutase n=2 Tax=Thermococcus kodakarensis (strain ATCC BAA-918 / JCM 12380 / KOD1) TaxID=69014 RepID=PPM_THEKO|nr:phosphoglucosamine mutase [Thermococcus kodakarensis]Q6I7B6.1 RecName: Full=Phosphopentomutase; Short=PPM [Thermococcus kodakarensis KOD1]WCN27688.1 phosphoglucosamine mutase [Thermococcus kodakarensis]WCN29980.1 phosphoglucosamine mutase [Thermococcus kodakarensis]BAD23919.1 phosphopentomutase [Thermococcus kodakarensis KOD1]BAD85966.1 phosphopentomutase [Thermococcus kodakarensis KOD1]